MTRRRRGDCGRLTELCAVCYTLQSTAGCFSSGTLIWEEEKKPARGTLKLAEENGGSRELFLERLGRRIRKEIRIRQLCCGYSLMGIQLWKRENERKLESRIVAKQFILDLWFGRVFLSSFYFFGRENEINYLNKIAHLSGSSVNFSPFELLIS